MDEVAITYRIKPEQWCQVDYKAPPCLGWKGTPKNERICRMVISSNAASIWKREWRSQNRTSRRTAEPTLGHNLWWDWSCWRGKEASWRAERIEVGFLQQAWASDGAWQGGTPPSQAAHPLQQWPGQQRIRRQPWKICKNVQIWESRDIEI